MRELRSIIDQVASSQATVMITGESGTGKELVAKCIHEKSPYAKGKFIALNCAALPENLLESELFGFDKGSFTGATQAKEGLFAAAHEGTLFLDEIGDMPLSLQAKLLRVLQEREVRRIGSTESQKINIRIITATHQNLAEQVKAQKFRQDLLYRLEVISIFVPPLRDRVEDIPVLSEFFLKQAVERNRREVSKISEDAMEVLFTHLWPGNVRELFNVLERSVIFAKGSEITLHDLPPHLIDLTGKGEKSFPSSSISVRLGTSLKEMEDILIRKTLEATSGDKNLTAKLLGVNSRTIYRKVGKSESE